MVQPARTADRPPTSDDVMVNFTVEDLRRMKFRVQFVAT